MPLGIGEGGEAVRAAEGVRVAGNEAPAAQVLQLRMRHDGADQPTAEVIPAKCRVDEDVAQ